MTKTERMNLFQWVGEDFVDLSQINANFDALEQLGGAHIDAARTLRHNLAHTALYQYHHGTLPPHLENLVLLDLSKASGEAGELVQLQDVDGMPTLIPAVEAGKSVSTTAADSINVGNAPVLCDFTPTGYGKITSITLPGANKAMSGKGCVVQITIETGAVLWQSEAIAWSTSAHTVAADCFISPEHHYSIRVKRTAAGGLNLTEFGIPAGTCTVVISGTVYASGSFCSNTFSLGAGEIFDFWVYHTGPAPGVEASIHGGAWQTLDCESSAADTTLDGLSGSCRLYRLRDLGGGTLRLRFTLSSSDTRIRECCGILL